MSNVPRADARSTQAQSDLATALHRVHPELVWGLAPPRDESSRWTIEISAGGLKGMIPTVQSLVQAAPDMSGWRVAAFKQPMPDFEVLLGAAKEKVDSSCVMVHPKPVADGKYDLDVFLPTPAGFPKTKLAELGFIFLDHILGEYAVMTRIGELTFDSTLVAPPGVISIAEFGASLGS